MTRGDQDERRRQIEAAAYELLAEKGYEATSMLAIAKRANASNETLYRWYGNKQTLFEALVQENAREVEESLRACLNDGGDPLQTLKAVGPRLLRLVTGDKAVVLNRAAASDVAGTGDLGRAIATAGRATVAPLLSAVLDRARDNGLLEFDAGDDIASIYIGLLIGDLQIRRVIGVCGPLSTREIKGKADRALALLLRLFGR